MWDANRLNHPFPFCAPSVAAMIWSETSLTDASMTCNVEIMQFPGRTI